MFSRKSTAHLTKLAAIAEMAKTEMFTGAEISALLASAINHENLRHCVIEKMRQTGPIMKAPHVSSR